MPDMKSEMLAKLKGISVKPTRTASCDDVKVESQYFSTSVADESRRSNAPYNFVPLPDPEDLGWRDSPCELDRFYPTTGEAPRYSGHLDISIKPLTPFYLRGMRTEDEYRSIPDGHTKQPFSTYVQSRITIPGSSLRGMVRSVVEVISAAPVDPVNEKRQVFHRPIGRDDDPQYESFDPSAVAYKKHLAGGRATNSDPAYPLARAGYVTADGDNWKIAPAQGPQWYRVSYDTLASAHFNPRLIPTPTAIWFRPVLQETQDEYHSHRGKFYKLRIVTDVRRTFAQGYAKGWLMPSADMRGKYLQWIVGPKDEQSSPVTMPREDIEGYENDTTMHARPKYKYRSPQNQPCFYVEWTDFEDQRHVTIGPTGYFRIPYEKLVGMANKARRREHARWDLAQAIFGRTEILSGTGKRTGQAGRVYFEDAVGTTATALDLVETVLSSPKLTSWEHYLVQKSASKQDAIHWDGKFRRTGDVSEVVQADSATIRGTKCYWHRGNGASVPPGRDGQGRLRKSAVSFCPAPADTTLTGRIRFENLDQIELGALITALDLPQDYGHKIGMGKPLGFGSIRVTVTNLALIDRATRYSRLFAEDGSALTTGAASAGNKTATFKTKFTAWAVPGCTGDLWKALDSVATHRACRLHEFRAMLRLPPSDARRLRQWQHATRYLGFNDYDRKPLPPASQVAEEI